MLEFSPSAEYDAPYDKWIFEHYNLTVDQYWSLPLKQRLMLFEGFVRCCPDDAVKLHFYSSHWRAWGISHFSIEKDTASKWITPRRRRGVFLRYACISCVNCADDLMAFKPFRNVSYEAWLDSYISSVEFTQSILSMISKEEITRKFSVFSHFRTELWHTYTVFSGLSNQFRYAPMPLDLLHFIAIPHTNELLWENSGKYLKWQFERALVGYEYYLRSFAQDEARLWLAFTEKKDKTGPSKYFGF